MTLCAFEGCENEAEEGLELEAELGGGRKGEGPWSAIFDRQEIVVPVCRPHYEYLTRDSLRGVSLG